MPGLSLLQTEDDITGGSASRVTENLHAINVCTSSDSNGFPSRCTTTMSSVSIAVSIRYRISTVGAPNICYGSARIVEFNVFGIKTRI